MQGGGYNGYGGRPQYQTSYSNSSSMPVPPGYVSVTAYTPQGVIAVPSQLQTHPQMQPQMQYMNAYPQQVVMAAPMPQQRQVYASSAPQMMAKHGQPSRSVYVGNIHPDTSEEEVFTTFSRFGGIESTKLMPQKNCAFVNFQDIGASSAAFQAGQQGLMMHGVQVRVNWGKPQAGDLVVTSTGMVAPVPGPQRAFIPRQQGAPGGYTGGMPPTRVLYIGNLPLDVTEDEILREYSQCAGIQSVRTMIGKGYAFVTFDTVENANAAKMEMTGRGIRGMVYRINYGKDGAGPTPTVTASIPQSSQPQMQQQPQQQQMPQVSTPTLKEAERVPSGQPSGGAQYGAIGTMPVNHVKRFAPY